MDPATIQKSYRSAVEHHQAGRLAEAERVYRRILSEHPDHSDALQMLGVLAHQAGRSDAGVRLLRNAIALNPRVAAYHANLGVILGATHNPEEAIASYRRALELSPDYPQALSNLGTLLHEQGKPEEAIELLSRSVRFQPDNAEAHKDLGIALREVGRLDEAIVEFQRALALQPQNHTARWSLGFTQLLKGDLEKGWQDLEARWEMKGLDPRRKFPQPLWDGSDLSGRRILVWAEQGLGDTIQFARYVPLIAARGAHVLIQCQPELQRLMQSVTGVEEVLGFAETPSSFDVHSPFMRLPGLFETSLASIPSHVPYLRPDSKLAGLWDAKLASTPAGFRIGLVWAGSATHKNDRRRSLALADFASFLDAPGVQIFSLQKGAASEQLRTASPALNLIDWSEELTDLAETAALVNGLDLLMSADTAVAHLAGALGKPVWVLMPFAPDWRWMLNRADSPWYPTMRLFRQSRPGDWRTALDDVRRELMRWSAGGYNVGDANAEG